MVVLALIRLRPATLIIAGNHLATLHALGRITQFGRPAAQAYTPDSVFSPVYIATGVNLLAMTTMTLACFALLKPNKKPESRMSLPPVPRTILFAIFCYYLLEIFSSKTIAQEAYSSDAWTVFGVNLGGLNALMHSLMVYEVFRRVYDGLLKPFRGFLFIVAVFILTDYSKGITGIATGYVVASAVLLAGFEKNLKVRWVSLIGGVAMVVGLAFVVRGVRASLYSGGLATVQSVAGGAGIDAHGDSADSSNEMQYAAHLLECITLYDAGLSREWRSIYNPIIYTLEPSFLLEPLGIERPREAAWELGDYYVGGGGIYVIGELYWNGGYLCEFLVFLFIVWWAFMCDTRYRESRAWLVLACTFAPAILQGFGYGFAQIARGALNGLWIFAGYWALSRLGSRSSRPPILRRTLGDPPVGALILPAQRKIS